MDNLPGILRALLKGVVDSLKGTVVIFYLDKSINDRAEKGSPVRRESSTLVKGSESANVKSQQKSKRESKVLKRTCQCCALNGGVFWASILLFDYLLLPGVQLILSTLFGPTSHTAQSVWTLVQPFLQLIFGACWVLPLFLVSKIVNSLWFQDIADSAYRYSRGRPQYLSSIGKLIADALFSVLVQFFFLIQTMIVHRFPLPAVGYVVALIHMCLLYSLYSFEYKWYNMGWELHKRLNFIESNWPYFVGFGLPLAFLTGLTSSYIVSGCIFSILFPLFIISANEAAPVTNVCDVQLQLFSPVIAISNALFFRTIGAASRDRPIR